MVLSRYLSSLLLPALAFLSLSARALPHSRTASKTAALKLAVRIGSSGVKSIAAADRARANLLQNGGSSSIDATNTALMYTADIGVGTPPTYYTLLVDTGSSNTWIGAGKSYVKTTTSKNIGKFGVGYDTTPLGSEVSGEEYSDTVTLNSDLVVEGQSIGVAYPGSRDAGADRNLDGILGLGPIELTEGTVSNANDDVPTVTDNLYAQGKISSEVLGVFFSPASADNTTGELTFGGYDASKITGNINYVPVSSTFPAYKYWGVDQSISYGDMEILSETAGIVDTGTTLILIATDAFENYKSATGATRDFVTGLLKISSDQYNELSSLYFNIGGVSYELTANAQIWPRSLNSNIGGTTDGIYLIVSDIGRYSKSGPFGSGLDFINGYCFLQHFYSVFDTTNSRVGFAMTKYTYATSN